MNKKTVIHQVLAIAAFCAAAQAHAAAKADSPLVSKPSDAQTMEIAPLGPIDMRQKKNIKEIVEEAGTPDPSKSSSISSATFDKLQKLVDAQEYESLLTYIERQAPVDYQATRWLESKAMQGHVYLMWVVAERHLAIRNFKEAIGWSYAALFATQQESRLCLDQAAAKTLDGKLASEHPKLLSTLQLNPMSIKEGKLFGLELLKKVDPYASPSKWACSTSLTPAGPKKGKTYDPAYYPYMRIHFRNAIRKQFAIEGAQEPLPPLPSGAPGERPRF